MAEVKLGIKIGVNSSGLDKATRGAEAFHKQLIAIQKTSDQLLQTQNKFNNVFAKQTSNLNSFNKSLDQRGRMILKAGGLGAQMMGQSTLGYAMRMSSVAGIGTEMVGGLSPVALAAAGAALGGLTLASKLVEVGFEALSSVVTSTAGAFLGAATSLGGGRGLQASIEASAKREGMLGAARMTVSPEERLSPTELDARSRRFKGFTAEEGIKAYNELGRYSAQQKSITTQDETFISQYALSSKGPGGEADLAGTAHMYGLLQAQGNTSEQAQKIMRDALGIGQHTSFGPADVIAHAGITEMTAELGGDRQANYGKVFGVVGGINKYTGNVDRSTTESQALITGLKNAEMKGNIIGPIDQKGRFTDLNASIAQIANMSEAQRKEIGFGKRSEGAKAIDDITAGAENMKMSIKEYLDTMSTYTSSQEQLTKDAQENSGVVQSLTESFKEIDGVISSASKPAFNALSETISSLAKKFPDYQDTMTTAITGMATMLADLTIIGSKLGIVIAYMLSPMVSLARIINSIGIGNVLNAIPGPLGTIYAGHKLAIGQEGRAAENDLSDMFQAATKDGVSPFVSALNQATAAAQEFKKNLDATKTDNKGGPPPQPNTSSTTVLVPLP